LSDDEAEHGVSVNSRHMQKSPNPCWNPTIVGAKLQLEAKRPIGEKITLTDAIAPVNATCVSQTVLHNLLSFLQMLVFIFAKPASNQVFMTLHFYYLCKKISIKNKHTEDKKDPLQKLQTLLLIWVTGLPYYCDH
jgi:hypothetical protein